MERCYFYHFCEYLESIYITKMIEIAPLHINEKKLHGIKSIFLTMEIYRKTSDKKSSLGYYYMLYQHHMWKTDYNLQHQEFPPPHIVLDISIETITNIYIKSIEFVLAKVSYYLNSS